MTQRLTSNNTNTTLAASITSTATSCSVVSGAGALFPSPGTSPYGGTQSFAFTLVKNGTPGTYEVCLCTQRSTDTFSTILRGQEGTTALSWSAGDFVYLYLTTGDFAQCTQFDDLQAQPGNYALDTGSANTYLVNLTPAVLGYTLGMPVRFRAGHTNTGTSTINVNGIAAEYLLTENGTQAPAGTIIAGSIYTCIWNGSYFYLQGIQDLSTYATEVQLESYATLVDLKSYALIESPALEGIPTAPTAASNIDTNQLATCEFVQNVCNGEVSTATNGYEVRPTGIIEMWGVAAFSGSSPQSVTFPTIAGASAPGFPTGCLRIHIMPIANGSTTVESFGLTAAPSANKEGFSVNSGSGLGFSWSALGY